MFAAADEEPYRRSGVQEFSNCLVAQPFRAAVRSFGTVSVERLKRADGSDTKITKGTKITNTPSCS